MQKVSGKQFANSAMWKFIELIIRKLVGLVISTILARLLAPEDYGAITITTVFIAFSDIFIMSGFNVALIRKEHVTEDDYSTVMIMSLIFSGFIYIVLFISSPFLATFYKVPELKSVLRVITILLFFQSVAAVMRAKATRELQFKKMSGVTIAENTLAGMIGLLFAFKGYGVWALVAQQLSANILDVLLLTIVFKWHFQWKFRKKTVKEMIAFTTGVVGASITEFISNNANGLVVGKVYNTTELGYINRGNLYPEVIGMNSYGAISGALLPTLASRQGDNEAICRVARKVASMSAYILFPMMLGLAGVSQNFIIVLLTDKWLPCLGIFICYCISYMVIPIRSIGFTVFYATGMSKVIMRIAEVKAGLIFLNLLINIVLYRRSIYVLALVNLIIEIIILILTQWYVRKTIGYTYRELLKDIGRPLLMSLPVLGVAVVIDVFLPHRLVVFVLQVLCGGVVYIIISAVTKDNNFLKLISALKEKIGAKA